MSRLSDGMTAGFYHFDMALLGRTANRIVNEVRGINRATCDIISKPPGTIESRLPWRSIA